MNIQEFETRTGLTIEPEAYAKVEQIYLNAESMDKDAFCKAWKLAKAPTLELIEELSHNVDGKRAHIDKLDIKIQNLEHDLEMEAERKKLRNEEMDKLREVNNDLEAERNTLIAEKVDLALALLKAGLDEQAIAILGHGYVISLKCSSDIELSKADKIFLTQVFNK